MLEGSLLVPVGVQQRVQGIFSPVAVFHQPVQRGGVRCSFRRDLHRSWELVVTAVESGMRGQSQSVSVSMQWAGCAFRLWIRVGTNVPGALGRIAGTGVVVATGAFFVSWALGSCSLFLGVDGGW